MITSIGHDNTNWLCSAVRRHSCCCFIHWIRPGICGVLVMFVFIVYANFKLCLKNSPALFELGNHDIIQLNGIATLTNPFYCFEVLTS